MTASHPEARDIDQLSTQAKELLKLACQGDPNALTRIHTHHPRLSRLKQSTSNLKLSDTQIVIARENGFKSWPKLREYALFRRAVSALDAGDLQMLDALLTANPKLVTYECHKGKWYETGYFAGATLLNHIAGNPIRTPLPENIAEVTKLLLRHGAIDGPEDRQRTLKLILTSKQASEAGVAGELIDLLESSHGTGFDLFNENLLTAPLTNVAHETAAELIRRGARMNLLHVAILGRIDLAGAILSHNEADLNALQLTPPPANAGEAQRQREEALVWASAYGHTAIAELLLDNGVDVNAISESGQPALHIAAHAAHSDTVRMLISRGANLEQENRYGGTALGQALWSAINEPKPLHAQVIKILVSAGANLVAAGYPTGNEQTDAMVEMVARTN